MQWEVTVYVVFKFEGINVHTKRDEKTYSDMKKYVWMGQDVWVWQWLAYQWTCWIACNVDFIWNLSKCFVGLWRRCYSCTTHWTFVWIQSDDLRILVCNCVLEQVFFPSRSAWDRRIHTKNIRHLLGDQLYRAVSFWKIRSHFMCRLSAISSFVWKPPKNLQIEI